MSLISAVDSYFSYVSAQLKALKATVNIKGSLIPQPMGMIVNAADWPQTPPQEGALYLLVIKTSPAGIESQSQAGFDYHCQWSWIFLGTDILAGQQATNRGDRYRANMQLMKNLRDANYPGYCRKSEYTADTNGNVTATPSVSLYPASAPEMITWSALDFMPRSDNAKTGLVYGAAAVTLHAVDDISTLVA